VHWRVENLKSFLEFLERRFPESRRKAYYLMSIHEHLPLLGTDKSRGYCLEMICADFPAGANLDIAFAVNRAAACKTCRFITENFAVTPVTILS